MKFKLLLVWVIALAVSACSVPKETIAKLQSTPKKSIEFPLEYANSFPAQVWEEWDNDYDSYDKFLTRAVKKTQMGLSYTRNGVRTWIVSNSAQPHVQLDTATRISDPNVLIGDWRVVTNRKITFTDSADFTTKKIYRTSNLIYDEKQADVLLTFDRDKVSAVGTESNSNKYKKAYRRNYKLDNGRYLLLYGSNLASASVALVGLDGGNLIYNQYAVIEDNASEKYIVYKTILTQFILQRI